MAKIYGQLPPLGNGQGHERGSRQLALAIRLLQMIWQIDLGACADGGKCADGEAGMKFWIELPSLCQLPRCEISNCTIATTAESNHDIKNTA